MSIFFPSNFFVAQLSFLLFMLVLFCLENDIRLLLRLFALEIVC